MGKPSSPKEDPATKRLRRQQLLDLAQLDEEQNARVKRMRQSADGLRAFRGSPDFRRAPGNRAGVARFVPPASSTAATGRVSMRGGTIYANRQVQTRLGTHYKRGPAIKTLVPADPG